MNTCAENETFEILSYSKEKKLGAQLVFNPFLGGGFYACGGDVSAMIHFKIYITKFS